jgi:hypothetical protein
MSWMGSEGLRVQYTTPFRSLTVSADVLVWDGYGPSCARGEVILSKEWASCLFVALGFETRVVQRGKYAASVSTYFVAFHPICIRPQVRCPTFGSRAQLPDHVWATSKKNMFRGSAPPPFVVHAMKRVVMSVDPHTSGQDLCVNSQVITLWLTVLY